MSPSTPPSSANNPSRTCTSECSSQEPDTGLKNGHLTTLLLCYRCLCAGLSAASTSTPRASRSPGKKTRAFSPASRGGQCGNQLIFGVSGLWDRRTCCCEEPPSRTRNTSMVRSPVLIGFGQYPAKHGQMLTVSCLFEQRWPSTPAWRPRWPSTTSPSPRSAPPWRSKLGPACALLN